MPLPRDVIVLVHGTTFGRDTDPAGGDDPGSTDAWWRPDQVRSWLQDQLPPDAAVSDDSFLTFRWTGRNSQVSRLDAGNELLALLLMLERKGHRYHLIGHSHGGSVIREALISSDITRHGGRVYAELRRALNRPQVLRGERPIIPQRPDEYAPWFAKHKTRYVPRQSEFAAVAPFIDLPGLRSWTTVGTPFLHYFPQRRPLVPGWASRRFTLHRPEVGGSPRAQLLEALLTLVLVAPFYLLFAMIVAGIAGWDWPSNLGDNQVTGALALPCLLVWIATFVLLNRQDYARTLIVRELAAQRVSGRFGDRWLGLWASSDEAINALTALAPKGPGYEWFCGPGGERGPRPPLRDTGGIGLPRLSLPQPVAGTHLLPDHVRFAPRQWARPVIWALNRWLEPLWRRKVNTALTRLLQGSDLPAATLAFVSPWPLPLAGAMTHPGLPTEVDTRLEQAVSDRTGHLRPAVRQLLMTAALEGIPAAVDAVHDEHGAHAAGALVHTSYFDDPAVGRLIALHISSAPTSPDTRSAALDEQDRELRWLCAHRETVRAELRAFLAVAGVGNGSAGRLQGPGSQRVRSGRGTIRR